MRRATPADMPALSKLMQETIRTVNNPDYTPEQIDIWCGKASEEHLKELHENATRYIAEVDRQIVGFGDIERDNPSEIGLLYVHHQHIRTGVGSALLKQLETIAKLNGIQSLSVNASITAKPFFEAKGFAVTEERQREVDGTSFKVYRMEKRYR